MLETIDLAARLDRDSYKQQNAQIQTAMNQIQEEALDAGLGVFLLFEGWEFAGKSDCVQYLTDPLDPRGFKVHVMYPPTEQEMLYPFARRYLIRAPRRGAMGFFLRSWYYHALDERIQSHMSSTEATVRLEAIRRVEQMLAEDGYLLLKFWFHIDKHEQHKRRNQFKKGKISRWRVGPDDPLQHKHYDEYLHAAEEMLAHTSTDYGRWYLIPAHDKRFARIAVASRIINRVQDEMVLRKHSKENGAITSVSLESNKNRMIPVSTPVSLLSHLDLTQTIEDQAYEKRLEAAQTKLVELQYECVDRGRSAMFVFQGWDAAGKGGIIKRLTRMLDPRFYEVHSIAAPRGDEADQHYLWRFWRRLPPRGHWAIFDRSWYGRVLVERVEGFATIPEWRRAFTEINDFEAASVKHGCILLKFWVHISPEEQLKRFNEREQTPYKRFKLTAEDWRNREKWPRYEQAAEDMFQRTSTPLAPWIVVAANDKKFGRVFALERAVTWLQEQLKGSRH